jgi:uncharacterized membrane protein (DUF485 family)
MQTQTQLLGSAAFKHLVARRWRVSLLLTAALFIVYYGYILLIAVNKPLLARRLAGDMPVGIPIGAAVILASWALTAIYIVWANRSYDPEVGRLKAGLGENGRVSGRASG